MKDSGEPIYIHAKFLRNERGFSLAFSWNRLIRRFYIAEHWINVMDHFEPYRNYTLQELLHSDFPYLEQLKIVLEENGYVEKPFKLEDCV